MQNEVSKILLECLLKEMKEGIYSKVDRLPPELELSQKFGVSRTAVRDCLAILEREGFINRQHGRGTVINRLTFQVTGRMDLEKEFLERISEEGYHAEIAWVNYKYVPADEVVSRQLKIKKGTEVLRVERLITADQRPAIYCIDYLSMDLLKKDACNYQLLKEPIFHFLESECKSYVKLVVTDITAVIADEHLSDTLKIEVGHPLLYMDETACDFFAEPILYAQEYFIPGILHHTVIRKKI